MAQTQLLDQIVIKHPGTDATLVRTAGVDFEGGVCPVQIAVSWATEYCSLRHAFNDAQQFTVLQDGQATHRVPGIGGLLQEYGWGWRGTPLADRVACLRYSHEGYHRLDPQGAEVSPTLFETAMYDGSWEYRAMTMPPRGMAVQA